MNIKCSCGKVYTVDTPKIEANLDVNIYTDGVVEGGSVPRDIKVFKCSSCNEFKYLAQCDLTESTGEKLSEPDSLDYLILLEDPAFDSLGLRVKAWQRSNNRFRNLDSLEDLGVKIELMKASIGEIPSVAHFDEYISKMEKRYEEAPSPIILEKIEELKSKKKEVLERLAEKKHLTSLEAKQASMLQLGEIPVEYSPGEVENMLYLLTNLEDDGAGLLIKSEILRNLGRFTEAIEAASKIGEKHYEKIAALIAELSQKKLKKVTFLKD